ncbi:MAG: type II secretion system F family protein [Nitrospirota bacterium]|nr:MAG: type II secretion system F family protein [Nitrospirota bacterium]
MPTFSYEATDRNGNRIKREIDAENVDIVRDLIKAENLIPIRIGPQKKKLFSPFDKANSGDLLIFTQELQTLLTSGMPLDKALFILSEHSEKVAMKKILKEVYSDIQKGRSLSQSVMRHKVFPELYVNMVRAGEEGGILEPVLRRIVSFLETTATLKQELLSSIIYPIFISLAGTLTLAVLMLYVIPKFTVIFNDLGQTLPLPTQLLISASNFFLAYWWAILSFVAIIAVGINSYLQTSKGKRTFDEIKLKIPVLKKLHISLAITRFSRTMGTLLNSGVPILSSIKISRAVVGNSVISEKLSGLQEGVGKGKGIYLPLKNSEVFPQIVSQMIAVGEESGTLEETFLLIADRFESESRNLIKRLISFLEPAIILIMAVFVGFIVLSMLMAIVGLYDISF